MSGRLPWTRDDDYHSRHTGTFGEVHVWKRIIDGKKEMAVVKIPTVPQHIGKFRAERDKMCQIHHPNIVKCLSVHIFNDDFDLSRHYKNGMSWQDVIVMEYCDSGNLRRVFNKCKEGLTLSSVLRLVGDVGSALQYLHEEQHIIHRDIKPENILLSRDSGGEIMYKVGDLGEVTEVHTAAGLTHISTLRTHGTFAYMAPEQLLLDPDDGTMKMNETADLWGFGTILSEATFGVRPFFHDHGHAIHTDLSRYCQCILEKPDDIIYIHKQGKLVDTKHSPVYCKDIPHSGTLPKLVVDKINTILCSALTGNRRGRGEPVNGKYMVYQQIKQLASLKVLEVFDCSTLQLTYHDITDQYPVLPDKAGLIYIDEDGSVCMQCGAEDDNVSTQSGGYLDDKETMLVSVSTAGENDVVFPSVPLSLIKYFSEPFPFFKKEVERGIEGYLHILKCYLNLFIKTSNILNITVNTLHSQCIQNELKRLQINEEMYSNIAEICNGMVRANTADSMIEVLNLSKSVFCGQCDALLTECNVHAEYITNWMDVFRGLSDDVEWTEVYTLVNQFKEDFSKIVTKLLKVQRSCAMFVTKVETLKEKIAVEEVIIMNCTRTIISSAKPGSDDAKRDDNIMKLLEENQVLYKEFIEECELFENI